MNRVRGLLVLTTMIVLSFVAVKAEKPPNKEWTILVFIEGRNNLSSFAEKHIRDMLSIGSGQNFNLLTQWYQPRKHEAYRYKIDHGKIEVCGSVSTSKVGNHKRDLIDSMQWAVQAFPAKHYCLVLWNHGLGIIDPVWTENEMMWGIGSSVSTPELQADVDALIKDNPRAQILGVTSQFIPEHRGILFNEQDRTYLSNQDLDDALNTIKHEVLGGNNLDILGMDACYMAMVEVSQIVSKYADYLVASEEVEFAQGWNYLQILKKLSKNSMTPMQLSTCIVDEFGLYHRQRTELYTQSAIELKQFALLKDNISEFVSQYFTCKAQSRDMTNKCIKCARRYCLQFTTQSFVDFHSFYKELTIQIEALEEQEQCFIKLRQILDQGMKIIENIVVANKTGRYLKDARGLGVYWPRNGCDSSYPLTSFAQDTGWYSFLKDAQK